MSEGNSFLVGLGQCAGDGVQAKGAVIERIPWLGLKRTSSVILLSLKRFSAS